MAYGITHFFPGGTKEQYEVAIAACHPARDVLPPGQIYHCAGPAEGGWVIVAVHESKASWEAFRDGTVRPAFAKGIPGMFAAPPQETEFEVYNQQP